MGFSLYTLITIDTTTIGIYTLNMQYIEDQEYEEWIDNQFSHDEVEGGEIDNYE